MAESKFLPYQDANGDGLIDVCEEISVPEPIECPECVPNPAAIVPDWLNRSKYQPFLNEKLCKYQVTVTTRETTTGFLAAGSEGASEAALNEIYLEYQETAIRALLTSYNKDKSDPSINAIKEVIENTEYSLDPRPKSRLKLLYSVPKENLDAIEDDEEEEEEEEAESGDISVTFMAGELGPMMMYIRKTLRLYNRYLLTYQKVEESNLLFLEDNRPFYLKNYGDWGGGMASNEIMSQVLPELDAFLNNKGYNIANIGGLFQKGGGLFGANDRLTEITFTFNGEYKIKQLRFFTEGCGEQPVIIGGRETGPLAALYNTDAWKDTTAMAYLASLKEMNAEIQARVAPNWIEFLKKYTYPEIYETDTVAYESTPGSCIGEALINEGKQLGQDVLDDVFGIADAIAYQWKDQLCKKSLGEAIDEQTELGILYNPYFEDNKSTYAMAQEQAFKTLEDQDQVFLGFCARVLGGMGMGSGKGGKPRCGSGGENSAQEMLDVLWSEGFEEFKLCGLMDFMMEAIQCLMGGLTLEEALGVMIERACQAMSINNFGDMWKGLPPDKQAELDALVKKKIESGDVFKDDSSLQTYSDGIAQGTGATSGEAGEASTRTLWSKPWEDETISEQEKGLSADGVGMSSEDLQDPGAETRTLVQQFDVGSEENRNKLDSNVVIQAYVQALLEVYQDNLLELVDELNKFPGAQLIANVIAFIDCPRPPFFNPSIMDFIKDIELPFCRDMKEIAFPRIQNPYGWFPKIMDILSILKEAFMCALQQVIIAIIMKLIVKVCELIGNAMCKALEMAGDAIAALVTPNDCTQFSDMVREALCGDGADDEMVNDTTVDMIASLGVGTAALADREQALAFAEDIGCSVTRKELAEALLGDMSNDMADAMVSLVENEYEDFEEALPHKQAMRSFFNGMGNLLPLDFRDTLRDFVNELPANDAMPAHPSLCATPEQVENFCDLRAELLADRASPEQIAQMCDNIRDKLKEDLGDLERAAQDPEGYFESNMPPLVSDPGCDNGLMPFEPDVAIATVTAALGNELEQLKVDYATDMIGNGPREKNWGLLNMVMSDTMGQPLTRHNRSVTRRRNPDEVDFYTGVVGESGFLATEDPIELTGGKLLSLIGGPPEPEAQRAAFPTSVAKWLRDDLMDKAGYAQDEFGTYAKATESNAIAASINNEWQASGSWFRDMEELGFDRVFSNDLELLSIPDMGYNVEMAPEFEPGDEGDATGVTFTELGRKGEPDLELDYVDNAKGVLYDNDDGAEETSWSYGFNMEVFFGDLIQDDDGNIVNRSDDNVRIKITDLFNTATDMDSSVEELLSNTPDPESEGGMFQLSKVKKTEKIIPSLRYEFLAVDDTIMDAIIPPASKNKYDPSPADLGAIKEFNILDQYTDFLQSFQTYSEHTPQTLLLRDMIKIEDGTTLSHASVKSFIEDTITAASQLVLWEIGNNSGSWSYGAEYDSLAASDIEYGVYDLTAYNKMDSDDVSGYEGWIPYSDYMVPDDDDDEGAREVRNRDMKLGISFNQYMNEYYNDPPTPEDTRVFYLDPVTFGGNYMNPGIYIKPLASDGWMGMVDVLFPDLSPCKPHTSDLVDFGSIQEIIDDIYPSIPEDMRLKSDPDCIIERPYNRILMRPAKAGLVGLITAACRIYSSVHLVKALPAYATFGPTIPDTYSSALASYVVETMEASFRDAGGGPEWVNAVFSDDDFWYAFLEQSVQLYSAMVDEGKIEPSPTVLEALFRINDMQEEYEYPDRTELRDAKDTKEAGRFETLKSFRKDKNLEAIRETEEDAKLVLKEWVIKELNFMGEKFMTNMDRFNMMPVVSSLDYYVMDKMCVGSELTLNSAIKPDGTFKASYVDLPTVSSDEGSDHDAYDEEIQAYYTAGSELVVGEDLDEEGLGKGEEYIGYYNVILDEEGNPQWLAGEAYTEDEPQDILHPMINQIVVEIGDVPELDGSGTAGDNEFFTLEKYIYIEGEGRLSPTDAVTTIKSNSDLTKNISDVYPGTMKIATNADGLEIGIEGNLGVRYGLQFGVSVGGTSYEITAVEVDALDLPLSEFTNLTADSRLLLCLLNLLKQDEKFKLVTRYILPLNKLTAIGAIYTDMGLLPSIGELTSPDGASFESQNPAEGILDDPYGDGLEKPGMVATVTLSEDEPPVVESVTTGPASEAVEGYWSSQKDRDTRSVFWLHFDEWDQVLLRNSSQRIKRLFKTYYNSRDFDPDDIGKAIEGGPGQIFLNRMRALLKPAPGKRLLPRWKRRKLRTNPFNANGELCEK